MKQTIYAVGFLIATSGAFGQLSKEEIKAVQKEMKSQTPEQYLLLKEDLASSKSKVITLEQELESAISDKQLLESEIKDYKAASQASKLRIDELESGRNQTATQLVGVQPTAEKVESTTDSIDEDEKVVKEKRSGGYASYSKSKTVAGLVYKVQIGAFRNYDITKYFNRHDNFSGTVDADGTMRYTLGAFSDYWEADKFKRYLRTMGVNGAWVVAYKDGKRISMKAAREGTF